MKSFLALMLMFSCVSASAGRSSSQVEATGTLYFEFDMASETQADGVNFAKFVPDEKSRSLFHSVTAGPHASPVRYISFEPAGQVLEKVLGENEARQVSHGTNSVIEMSVKIQLRNFRTEIEFDSRVYYADLVSATSLEHYQIASNTSVPNGC